jgi:putative mRNA 3-end processing factor
MKITVLGAGQEVGRSAILVEDKSSVVLDFGTKVEPEPPKFPIDCKPDFAVISHAHLDHIGGAPILFKHAKPPIFMTDVTMELTAMLIKDSMKVARKEGYNIPFSNPDLKKMIKHTRVTNYNEDFSLGALRGRLYDAGHIPGSAGVLLTGRKKLFYTGDIQASESRLLNGCSLPKSADVLVTESTYGHRNHAKREDEEKKLLSLVEEAFANDGSVLLPAFSVGRSQELLMMLEKYANTIAIDGMVRTASEIIEDYGSRLKNPRKLRGILSKVKFLRSEEDRSLALKKHQIIIASAGMLGGGPAVRYLRELKDDQNSKIIFSGFLVDGTPGKNLLETGIFENSEEGFEVKCQLHKVDLSAHAGKTDLFGIIQKTKPELVICVHGDACPAFAKDIEKSLGIKAIAPKNGEHISI